MATKAKKKAKKTTAKKGAPKRKLDGKKLAAQRKPRDSISQYIKDQFADGKKDVNKILEGAIKEFPGTKPTPGYIRHIAKQEGVKGLEPPPRGSAEKPAKKGAKKKTGKKVEADSVDAKEDPAS